jgi:hypothetical protein
VRLVEDNCGARSRGRICEGLVEWVASFGGRKKGVKGTWLSASRGDGGEAQVVGKLFAEKPGHADGIAQTLGKIWCLIKGIRCRDLCCSRREREGLLKRVHGSLEVTCL